MTTVLRYTNERFEICSHGTTVCITQFSPSAVQQNVNFTKSQELYILAMLVDQSQLCRGILVDGTCTYAPLLPHDVGEVRQNIDNPLIGPAPEDETQRMIHRECLMFFGKRNRHCSACASLLRVYNQRKKRKSQSQDIVQLRFYNKRYLTQEISQKLLKNARYEKQKVFQLELLFSSFLLLLYLLLLLVSCRRQAEKTIGERNSLMK